MFASALAEKKYTYDDCYGRDYSGCCCEDSGDLKFGSD
jgi:hypothetical protein